jgi:ABC-type transport system involved in multi-copper enzyme maturation permease subunit
MMQTLLDQFGDFSPYDLPSFLYAVLAAALIVWLLGFAVNASLEARERWQAMLLSFIVAAVVALVKGSLPLAVISGAALLMVRNVGGEFKGAPLYPLAAVVIGICCGARAVLIGFLLAVPLFLLLRLNNRKESL